MKLKESPRRLWALVGAGGSLLIIAVSYLLLISGQKSARQDLESQADSARQLAIVSKHKLLGLQQDHAKLPQYEAQLARLGAALPKTPETAQLVADLQNIAASSSVKITAINVSPPAAGQTGAAKTAGGTALPVTVATKGATANLEKFLSLLQSTSPRAVLVGTVTETVPSKSESSSDNQPTLNVGMKAFFGRA